MGDYKQIDPTRLHVWPLRERRNSLAIDEIAWDPDASAPVPKQSEPIDRLAETIRAARTRQGAVMLTYGAHLIKNGGGPLLRRLVEDGWITHLATQGAGVIHDWEFAFAGVSSESVRDNAPKGTFGAWDETGRAINLAVLAGAAEGLGFGESVGRFISEDGVTLPASADLEQQITSAPRHPLTGARADLLAIICRFELPPGRLEMPHPHKQYSVPEMCYRKKVPFTVHPGIGYDIFTNHPMFCGAAVGRGSDTDIRRFAASVETLSGGVYLSVGSAIMSPQVFEKAFSAANNLRAQTGQPLLGDHTIAVVDIQDGGGWDWTQGEPPKDHPAYYLRFCKSFYRMGGHMHYLQEDNCTFLHALIARLCG
jgi:hypothetical protein